jgi:carbon catabolite-derepressing protein kinase
MTERCESLAEAILAQRRIADAPNELSDDVCSAKLSLVREVLLSPHRVVMVCELAPMAGAVCEDLLTLLQRRGRLSEPDARRIFTRLVLATKRAHDCGVVLRNIKPEVVQLRQQERGGEYDVCLAQLHSSACVPIADEAGTLTGLHGTPEYAAPEVAIWYWHECSPPRLPEPPPPYGAKADVWALGMCLHVMLCG